MKKGACLSKLSSTSRLVAANTDGLTITAIDWWGFTRAAQAIRRQLFNQSIYMRDGALLSSSHVYLCGTFRSAILDGHGLVSGIFYITSF